MRNILITGRDSYIGIALKKWLMKEPHKYKVDSISIRNNSWKENNFRKYDVIFHVAGIAHIKESEENQTLYYNVNRDLAYEVAKKAKLEGVKQFIFLSSMSVYGKNNGVINQVSIPNPKNAYGKSKLEAEKLINNLRDKTFFVAILRPPMVYGKGCKGNYPRLTKLAVNTPIFPKVNNKRSMIYIDNLSEFSKQLIDNQGKGLFFPQNREYVNTSEMVRLIAEVHKKKILMPKLLCNYLINLLDIELLNKVFGDLVYDQSMSKYEYDYQIFDFENSIRIIEETRE